MATLGLYGAVAFGVTTRRRELGIRIVLGARKSGIVQLVVVSALRRVFVALMLGLALAFAASRLIRGLLFETPERDVTVYMAVAGLALFTTLLASAFPAWRATRASPSVALQSD